MAIIQLYTKLYAYQLEIAYNLQPTICSRGSESSGVGGLVPIGFGRDMRLTDKVSVSFRIPRGKTVDRGAKRDLDSRLIEIESSLRLEAPRYFSSCSAAISVLLLFADFAGTSDLGPLFLEAERSVVIRPLSSFPSLRFPSPCLCTLRCFCPSVARLTWNSVDTHTCSVLHCTALVSE